MTQRKSVLVVLMAVIACLVYIWFAFVQQPVPRAVVWQNRIYTCLERPPAHLQWELVASLEQVSVGGKTFYVKPEIPAGMVAPLELFLAAGDGKYYVYERTLDQDELLVRKPNIYLYSTGPTAFNVKVTLEGVMTASDPVYTPSGWSGVAHDDGMINRTIPYLFYEFATRSAFNQQYGWCIATSDFAAWCEGELADLGLNERERADFVDYWKHVLPDSPYISIYLQPRALVERIAKLHVTPAPDAILRLFFFVVPGEEYEEIPHPQIMSFVREGFTLVEWGVIMANQPGK